MNPFTDELARLRAGNPVPVEPDRGRTPAAAATLARILKEPIDEAIEESSDGRSRARRPGGRIAARSSRRLLVVLAGAFIAGGAAFAATDPLGWWSANPTYAKYGSDPAVHVRTPAAQTLVCARPHGDVLRCVPASWTPDSPLPLVAGHPSTGQPYGFAGAISPPAHGITRHRLLAYIASRRAAGKMTTAAAARFRADLAAVPDGFFTELEYAGRFATIGGGGETRDGLTQVPPRGVASTIVCEPATGGLSCQNLNGDEHAPVGAGIYGATPTRAWRYERVPPENSNLPPGISFTRAEYRVLIDMLRFGTLTQSSGPRSGTVPRAPALRAQRASG
jgi:hypothetical protein